MKNTFYDSPTSCFDILYGVIKSPLGVSDPIPPPPRPPKHLHNSHPKETCNVFFVCNSVAYLTPKNNKKLRFFLAFIVNALDLQVYMAKDKTDIWVCRWWQNINFWVIYFFKISQITNWIFPPPHPPAYICVLIILPKTRVWERMKR